MMPVYTTMYLRQNQSNNNFIQFVLVLIKQTFKRAAVEVPILKNHFSPQDVPVVFNKKNETCREVAFPVKKMTIFAYNRGI